MIDLSYWMMWLRSAGPLMSLPFIVAGLALLLGGWRLGLICVIASYAAVGGLAAFRLTTGEEHQWLVVGVMAVLLGGLSVVLRRFAVPALGGVIGGGLLMQVLASLGLHDWSLWIAGVVALVSVTALCHAHARNVLIVITSFEGAALLLSGLVPLLSTAPGVFRFFDSLTRSSDIFFPFAVMVPTLVGVFLQMADARNKDSGMTQA